MLCILILVWIQQLLRRSFVLFYRIDTNSLWSVSCLPIAFKTFARRMLITLPVDQMLLPSYVNSSTNFKDLPPRVDMFFYFLSLKYMSSVLFRFKYRPVFPTVCSSLCSLGLCIYDKYLIVCEVCIRQYFGGVFSSSSTFFFKWNLF